MKRTIKILVLCACIMLLAVALVACGCSNGGSCQHDWNGGMVTKSPTCISEGTTTYTCNLCSETYTESIAMLEHTKLYQDVLDGTHNVTCSYCTLNEYVAHTPTEDEGEAFEATCTEAAYTLLTCKDCNGQYKLYTPDSTSLGHDWNDWETTEQANCQTKGVLTQSCKNCTETETIVIDENPDVHVYDNGTVVSGATCVSDGEKMFICTLCGGEKTTAIPKTTQHTWDEGEADGTGWVTQSCTVDTCGTTRKHYDASTLESADVTINDLPDEDVSLGLQNATIQLPSDVVSQIKGSESEKVEISAGNADKSTIDTSSMSEEEKSRLETTTVYDFGISIGGKSIGDFNSQVTVTIPYELGENEDSEGIVIWYVTDSGKIEEVPAVYDETSETVTFSVSHFSYYAVAYKESQAMKCKRGVHDMQETSVKYEPNCYTYGFTVYQCSCCLVKEAGNIKNRLDHSFGSFKDAEVTCEEGGYKYRVCENEGCGYVQNAEYVRAKGHTINTVPTCEDGVYCQTCNKMVKTPLGHDYTPWTIDKNATEYEDGQKSRLCRKCGNKETVTILAGTGIDAAHIESYQDLFEFVLRELVGSNKGTMTMSYNIAGQEMSAKITLDVTEDSFKAYIESIGAITIQYGPSIMANEADTSEIDTKNMKAFVYYDNGMCYVNVINGDSSRTFKTDINSAFANMTEGTEFGKFFNMVEEGYYQINAMIEEYSATIRQVIDAIPEKFAGQIPQIYNAIETAYVYFSLRLGFDTSIKMSDGVETPTAKDVLDAFGTLLTKQEVNGEAVYTFDIQAIINEIKSTLNLIKENQESTLGQFLYICYEDAIKTIYPDVTSFEGFMAKLKSDFSGETTVGQAFVKLASYLLKLDFTMDEIYDAFDSIMAQIQPMPEDAPEGSAYHDMLVQYANMTLDQLLTMIGQMEMPDMDDEGDGDDYYGNGGETDKEYGDGYIYDENGNIVGGGSVIEPGAGENELPVLPDEKGENELQGRPLDAVSGKVDSFDETTDGEMAVGMTMADIWAQAEAMLSQMTLAQLTIPVNGQEMTLIEGVTMIEQMLDSYKINLVASVTLTANGEIKLCSLNGDVTAAMPNPENPEELVENKLGAVSISFDSTNTEIKLADEFKQFVTKGAEYHFDSEGNLIITGVNGNNAEIHLYGSIDIPLSTLLEKDEALSKELGIEVYHRYTTDRMYGSSYIRVNGRYYSYNSVPKGLVGIDRESLIPDPVVDKEYAFGDIVADPSILIPDSDAAPIGRYQNRYYIYHSPIGFITKLDDGNWYILNDSNLEKYTTWSTSYDYDSNTETTAVTLDLSTKVNEIPLLSAVQAMKFYILKESESYNDILNVGLFGGSLDEKVRQITLASTDGSFDYLYAYGYFNNDELYLLSYKPHSYTLPDGDYVYVLLEDVTDSLDLSSPYISIAESTYRRTCYLNGKTITNATQVTINYNIPTHEYYYKVDNDLFINFNDYGVEGGVDVRQCESTITLPNNKTMYVKATDGNNLFGYVELGGGYYIQTYALCYNDTVEKFEYRNAESTLSLYSSEYSQINALDKTFELDKHVTKSASSIIVSKDLFAELEKCYPKNEDEYHIWINVSVSSSTLDRTGSLSDLLSQSVASEFYVPFLSCSEINLNDSYDGYDSVDWNRYFDSESYHNFNIMANEDGTVSLYLNGKAITLTYNVSGIPADKVGSLNQSMTDEYGAPIYGVEETHRYGSSLVLIGGKLYNWSTYHNYKVTYIPQGSSYKITDWYFDDLRYMATSDYEGKELDIYEAEVYCKTAYNKFSLTVYVAFTEGKLYVLGGCEVIGDNAVKFESLVKPNDYFPYLIPALPSASQLNYQTSGYVNGSSAVKTIYYGYVEYYEPSSICLEGDSSAGRFSIEATVNGNTVSFISNREYLGTSLIIGNQTTADAMAENDYYREGNHTSTFYNGTYTFADFVRIKKDYDYYFKLAGKFYYFDNYSWRYYTYTKEGMIEAFYDKTFLYGVVDENGDVILYTGDEFSSEAVLYEGDLKAEDADKFIKMDAGFIEGYDEVYQYIFYSVPEGSQIVTVDGTELYISESGSAFAKAAENVYIDGSAIENGDGSFEFDPYDFNDGVITDSSIIKEYADKLTSLSENGVLKLSLEFGELFKNCEGSICVYSVQDDYDYYEGRLSIEELMMYFDLASEK